jgi:hypothetical protein
MKEQIKVRENCFLKKRFLLRRRLEALKTFFFQKELRNETLKLVVKELYTQENLKKGPIPSSTLTELTSNNHPCRLLPLSRSNGNLHYYELFAMMCLIQELKPKTLLEIGTFNGLTTLHMALNTDPSARIYTLDLLTLEESALSELDPHDIQYIENQEKLHKHYENSPEKEKIQEFHGNSLNFPFNTFNHAEFIFIDGSHSYSMVKNDTEKSLEILQEEGCILWHDYTPDSPGVFHYLNELSATYSLLHIKETSLVYYKKKPRL